MVWFRVIDPVKFAAPFLGLFGGAYAGPTCTESTCAKPSACPPLLCAHALSDVRITDAGYVLRRLMMEEPGHERWSRFISVHGRCCTPNGKDTGWEERCYFPGKEPCKEGEVPAMCLSTIPIAMCPFDNKEDDWQMCPEEPYSCVKFREAKKIEEEFGESYRGIEVVECEAVRDLPFLQG